jgi:hypothetical protein
MSGHFRAKEETKPICSWAPKHSSRGQAVERREERQEETRSLGHQPHTVQRTTWGETKGADSHQEMSTGLCCAACTQSSLKMGPACLWSLVLVTGQQSCQGCRWHTSAPCEQHSLELWDLAGLWLAWLSSFPSITATPNTGRNGDTKR